MEKKTQMRHQSIITYVKSGATIFNTVFLIIHICFGIFFKSCDATALYNYNLVSIAIYLLGYVMLYFTLSNLYSVISNLEVFIFMILACICLGWDYGFQQYCTIFVVSLLFTDYSINENHKVKKSTIATIILVLVAYFGLRIWTYSHPCVYELKSNTPKNILFLINSAIAFIFVVAYSFLYSQTVYKLEQALVEVATKDALTGLYNRRKMQDLLNAMSELLSSAGNNMCIAMLDIDNFKKVNDTYGHDAGDEVLKRVAGILLAKNKKDDSFYSCRWGGEEFLIFYRANSLTNEQFVKEFDEIRQEIANQTVVYNEQEIRFTITTGLAFYQKDLTITQMIKQADENLYVGKNSGKNVVIY